MPDLSFTATLIAVLALVSSLYLALVVRDWVALIIASLLNGLGWAAIYAVLQWLLP